VKDPTARAAARNVEGTKRAAVLTYRNPEGQPDRVWLDPDTLKVLITLVYSFTDEGGERHIRFKQEAGEALERLTGQKFN
jgi:hypothetical protein